MLSAISTPTDHVGLIELFADAKLAQAAPPLSRWYDQATLRTQFREALSQEVERVFSADLAALFRQHAPVTGVDTDDAYRNRVLQVPGLGMALVGIRFRALDLERPFVTVVAHTIPLSSAEDLKVAVAALATEFAAFAPKHVQVFVPAGVTLNEQAFSQETHWDLHIIAAPVAQLRERPDPVHQERISLEVPTDLACYSRYARELEALFVEHPKHRDFTRIEDEEDLEEYRADGLMFEVKVENQWAGLVTVYRSAEHGLKGFVVAEMFLDGTHRGRGLGPIIGRQLVDQLPAKEGDVLYGTIHHDNLAARRSAERTGREDVGAFFWVSTSI